MVGTPINLVQGLIRLGLLKTLILKDLNQQKQCMENNFKYVYVIYSVVGRSIANIPNPRCHMCR